MARRTQAEKRAYRRATVDYLRGETERLRAELEQRIVQEAGVTTALDGHHPDPPCEEGAYGWSANYAQAMQLRAEVDAALAEITRLRAEFTQARRDYDRLLDHNSRACIRAEQAEDQRDAAIARAERAEAAIRDALKPWKGSMVFALMNMRARLKEALSDED